MKWVYAIYKRLLRSRWEVGFVRRGQDGVFSGSSLKVDWIINPFRDRWFADPFILDVTEDYVYVLAEEFEFKTQKGRIAKLTINRRKCIIESYTILLELPTHLSFPNILRRNGKIYVYPESCHSGKLVLYELDSKQEKLVPIQTICDDSVWDSSIVILNGSPQLFTSNKNDYSLDIYDWNDGINRFVYSRSIPSVDRSSRMAGQLFEYHGTIYMPSQYCEKTYGGSVIIKEVSVNDNQYSFREIKRLESPHPKRKAKLHTLNVYKDIVIIDVGGYDFPCIANLLKRICKSLKK